MPGLFGRVMRYPASHSIDRDSYNRILDVLREEGCNYKIDTILDDEMGIYLSRLHLGILDQEKQPYINPSEEVYVFVEGDLIVESPHSFSPSAYVYRLYNKYGKSFVNHLNGSFVICIIDKTKKEFLLVVDYTASRPLYYYSDAKSFYFAPELKGLSLWPGFKKELDYVGILQFLSNGYFLADRTYWQNAKLLKPASLLILKGGEIEIKKYGEHSFPLKPNTKQTTSDYIDRLGSILTQVIQRYTVNRRKLGLLFSGGYDSRGIAGLAKKSGLRANNAQLITWGTPEFRPESDIEVAKKLAPEFPYKHVILFREPSSLMERLEKAVWLTDGATDSCFHHFDEIFRMKQIREDLGVEILLRGDECFGWSKAGTANNEDMLILLGIRHPRSVDPLMHLLKSDLRGSWLELSDREMDSILESCTLSDISDRRDYFYFHLRLFRYLHPLTYYKLLTLEVRNPWLDRTVLEFISKVPTKLRTDKYLYRKTLLRILPEFHKVPFAKRHNMIDWMTLIPNDEKISKYIKERLLRSQNPLLDFVEEGALEAFVNKTLMPSNRHKQTFVSNLADFLRSYPSLYKIAAMLAILSKQLFGIKTSINNVNLIVRLLILRIWLDQFYDGNKLEVKRC